MKPRSGILVVDDTIDTLKAIVATLAAEGYAVRPVTGGQQALDAIQFQHPELILLDMRMPGIDGFEVCRRIQSDEVLKTIPVLFLSSTGESEERLKGFAVGGVDFIPKPFQREELLARVHAHLELSRFRSKLEEQVQERTEHLRLANEQIQVELAERKSAEQALRISEEKYRHIVENAPIAIYQRTIAGMFQYVNPGLYQQFECASVEEFLEKYGDISKSWVGPISFDGHRKRLVETGSIAADDVEFRLVDGRTKWFSLYSFLDREQMCINGFAVDITAQKMAEIEREKLQFQLQKSQKLECIGNLAGGVAHDFNNMLTIILCHAQMGMSAIQSEDPVYVDFEQIYNAGRRSANLTRQLLAFARSQAVAPVVMDINPTIKEMLSMLSRLIGDSIELKWIPCPEKAIVSMDPSQVDQILANLCVNARDAIDGKGVVTISTELVALDAEFCQSQVDIVPGDYVQIRVSDTGCGMSSEVMEQIYEPFFTTKEVGKGTGLGLSTVYGIVGQNKGLIRVESVVGQGTTFHVYLPSRSATVPETAKAKQPNLVRGTETILLMEDSPTVRDVAKLTLERSGYRVLAPDTPTQALEIARSHPGEIHLLLSDIFMPEMNGKELREKVLLARPNIRWLFMTGYSSDVISRQGFLEDGMRFLQKPFTPDGLTAKVAQVLGAA